MPEPTAPLQTAPALPTDIVPEAAVAPAQETPSQVSKPFDQMFDSLDDGDTKPTPPAKEKTEPATNPEKAKVEPKKEEKSEPTKPEAEKEKPVEAAGDKEEDGLPVFRTNKEVRQYAKAQRKAAIEAEAKRVELENKLKQLETVVPKTQQGAEVLAQQLAEAQKRLAQHEQVIEMQSFEHSDKYQKEYATPYYNARQKAYKEISEMLVNEETGERDAEDKPVLRQRAATKADFDRIYGLPRAQARAMAKAMFGDDADEVMAHRKNISELAEKAQTALEERRQNYAVHKQQEIAQKSQQQIAIEKLWKTANENISKDPKRQMYWGEDPDDPEANKALASGFKLADEFFSEKRDQMTPEERVEFDAHIRHSIAMGPRLAYKVKKLSAENSALKEEVAQLRGSAPGAPQPVGEEQAPKEKTLSEALDALG